MQAHMQRDELCIITGMEQLKHVIGWILCEEVALKPGSGWLSLGIAGPQVLLCAWQVPLTVLPHSSWEGSEIKIAFLSAVVFDPGLHPQNNPYASVLQLNPQMFRL